MDDETGRVMRYEEEFVLNSRGVKLFTCRWLPTNEEPKALIFLCHGYAMECSISMKGTGSRLAKAGYAVYGMDCEGHGKSSGLQGYIPCFDDLVSDCSNHYTTICEKEDHKKKLRVLFGESMGGAVALLLHRKKPDCWDGAVLVAPMCKISDDLRPSPLVTNVLSTVCRIFPKWKIVPTQDIIDTAFRDPEVRKEIRSNPLCYKGKPRLRTAYELIMVSVHLEQTLEEVSIPLILIVHGEEDKVTDPTVSKLLFESARSTDKTFKLYPGMWHSLTYGELPENTDTVFSDIIAWLDSRAASGNPRLEREQKLENDTLHNSDSSKDMRAD